MFKNEKMNHSDRFEVVQVVIDGARVVSKFTSDFIRSTTIEEVAIEKVIISLHGDCYGISEQSEVLLADSNRVLIDAREVNRVVENIFSQSLSGYEILCWVSDPKVYNEEKEDPLMENCNVRLVAVKGSVGIMSVEEIFTQASRILKIVQENIDSYIYFEYDHLFEKGRYFDKLLDVLIHHDSINSISRLIFDVGVGTRASWAIAQKFIRSINQPLSGERLSLMKRLIESPNPLNDYWKERLATKYFGK